MNRYLTLLAALLFAAPAAAVDPECVGKVGTQPVYAGCELKMTGVTADLRFCSPQLDVDGDPLLDGVVASCTVTLDGAAVQTVPITGLGQLFTAQVAGKNLGHQIGAFCTDSDGNDGGVWVSDLCFPSGKPGEPHFIP
jgi:hypothetical protein